MQKNNKPQILSIHQAVGNLAILSDFDREHPYSYGLYEDYKFVMEEKEIPREKVVWISEENMDLILEGIKNSYQVIEDYFKQITQDKTFNWKSQQVQKGIQEIMELVGKTQDTIDRYLKEVDKVVVCERLGQSEVYLSLIAFYQKTVQKMFPHPLEGAQEWEENWVGEKALLLDLDKSSLKNFDAVKIDQEYELFVLKSSDGNPFFRRELLRNIELYCDFDEEKEIKLDDPLLKIPFFKDKNMQGVCDQVVKGIYPFLGHFYKKDIAPREKRIFYALNKVLMALFLTANPHNLIGKTKTKNVTEYFRDVQVCLHAILVSKEYNRSVTKDNLFTELIHRICYHYFLNKGAVYQEIVGFIHFLMRKGLELSKKPYVLKEDTIWNRLMKGDDQLRYILSHFPNGPLFKILDAVREKTEGFYPLMQENIPKQLWECTINDTSHVFLKIPSPTKQTKISEAHIAIEFLAFLRGCKKKEKKVLLFQLQDRTSWKEHPRAKAIETLGEQKEFRKNFSVVSLTKNTDFYYQIGTYRHLEQTKDFISLFEEQLLSPEDYGLYFSKELDTRKFRSFIPKAIEMIWEVFFEKRSTLTRKNRLDFIEIFYHICVLKIIEIIQPDILSFTCKDAIDIGSVFSASFYAFLSLLSKKEIDEDFLRYLFYAEALMVRERAISYPRLSRSLSFLSYFDERLINNKDQKLSVLATLFTPGFLQSIKLF